MKRRRTVTVLLILFAFMCGVYGYGTNLPETHELTLKTVVHQPRETVWSVVDNYAEAPQWSHSVTRIEHLPDQENLPVWRFYGRDGRHMDVQVLESHAPQRHVSRIVASDYPFIGSWTIELEDAGNQTLVTLTEEGRISNPVWRLIMRYILKEDQMVRGYLEELGHKFGETPHIVR
ncbi:MAG: SRPBCC family protein [Rickettsiales bacterium]|nr:SRPBCC family protein [Rickettsiales bacterium]